LEFRSERWREYDVTGKTLISPDGIKFHKADGGEVKVSADSIPNKLLLKIVQESAPIKDGKNAEPVPAGQSGSASVPSDDIPAEIINRAAKASVVIRTPRGGGSGFICEMEGGSYVVTNQHVLLGTAARDIKITDGAGRAIYPVAAEIADGKADLVRLRLKDREAGLKIADREPVPTEKVCAIGNSLDSGVLTVNNGSLIGSGAEMIEADCKFVPGNSGGPLIDKQGFVLAIPTLIVYGSSDRSAAGTRYAENRRFSTRLTKGQKWIPVLDWVQYAKLGSIIARAEMLDEEVNAAADVIITNKGKAFESQIPLVNDAMDAYVRLLSKMKALEGKLVTEQELARNNNILAATYRVSAQKLRDSLAGSIRDLSGANFPEQWGWLDSQRQASLKRLSGLYNELDEETKSRPRFMSFKK